VRAAFEPLLARWHGAPPRVAQPPGPRPTKGRVFFVHVPKAEQSSVTLMTEGPDRKAEDYFATQLLAQTLASGFSSRVNMNLREDKGYSYGAGGGFGYPNRWYGSFAASSSVRANSSAQSLIELRKEVLNMQNGSAPARPEELNRDKEGTILGMPARFSTAASTLGQYRTLVYFGLPLDYWSSYVDHVRAVTLEEIKTVAAKRLQPDAARYLVVGDGDGPQIAHIFDRVSGKGSDQPMVDESGKQLTLRESLAQLVADQKLGPGSLIELDVDGKVVKRPAPKVSPKAKAPTPPAPPAGAPPAPAPTPTPTPTP
jgi:predicted Zn-dependent peptidase